MNEIDEVIEQYKRDLVRETELVGEDVHEIEDHLRALTAELRERGMSAAEAVRAACERLGEPRAVAREHAKVHTLFGAKLSWARTISVAALLTTLAISSYVALWANWGRMTVFWPNAIANSLLFAVITVGLLARKTWPRPIILGAFGYALIASLIVILAPQDGRQHVWPREVLLLAAPIALVAPWRRGELSRGGYALALQAFAFAAMMYAAARMGLPQLDEPKPERVALVHMAPAALIGFVPALFAIVGTITRARWSIWASAFSAAMLFLSAIEVGHYYIFQFREFPSTREWLPFTSMLFTGAIGSLVAAFSVRAKPPTARYALR